MGAETAQGQTAADIVRERLEASREKLEGDASAELKEHYSKRIEDLDELLALLESA